MNILILVLSARRQPWGDLMDVSMETWDAEDHPQTRTIYYCGKPDIWPTETVYKPLKVFYSPTLSEELDDVSSRTIEAFEFALKLDWDFLARPNSSCYVHKRNLVKFCETLPRQDVLYGVMTEGEKPFLWGGCQYIMSRDVVKKMVANKGKWNHKLMDDQSITEIAKDLDIPITNKGQCASINLMPDGSFKCIIYGNGASFLFTDFEDINRRAEGHFFFRVKQDLRRHEDVRIMRELKRCLA